MPTRKLKEETELFYAYLRQNGLKKTYQKDLILETFLSTEGHLSVEDIYALVKKRDKKVGVVTVFRTLKSLTACGIAREIMLGDGLTRFEHSYHHPHHHHIVCTECHKAIEFISPELEKIQEEIIKRYHFQPVFHRFQTYGVCEDCREHRPVPEAPRYDTGKIFARDAAKMAIYMLTRSLEFYREAGARNHEPSGSEVLDRISQPKELYLSELKAQLEEIIHQEKGLDRAPIFLHFDPCEIEELFPKLTEYEKEGELRLDAKTALQLAITMEQRSTQFFRTYAEEFIDTQGKQILLAFAEEAARRFDEVGKQIEQSLMAAAY